MLLGDGNHSIAKCLAPLADHPRLDLPEEFADLPMVFDAMVFSHDHQELYQSGGLGGTFSSYWGWELDSFRSDFRLKFSSDRGTDLKIEYLTTDYSYGFDFGGIDSHNMVVHNDYLYKIGGGQHNSYGQGEIKQYDVECGYDNLYKYSAAYWGEVQVMPLSGVNATLNWDWLESLVLHVAMACSVSVNDQYIYVIGGFSEIRKDQIKIFDTKNEIILYLLHFSP